MAHYVSKAFPSYSLIIEKCRQSLEHRHREINRGIFIGVQPGSNATHTNNRHPRRQLNLDLPNVS